jgi:hypothetical protein
MVLFPLCFVHLDMPTGIGGHLAIDSFGLAVLKTNYSLLTPIWIARRFALKNIWRSIARLHPVLLVDGMKDAAGRLDSTRPINRPGLRLCSDTRRIAKFSDPEINYWANFARTLERVSMEG